MKALTTISKLLFSSARKSRDLNAITRSIERGSFAPILKRLYNKIIGRKIVSKVWWR